VSTDAEHDYKIDPRLRRYAEIGFVAAEADRSGCACWLDPETGRPRATPPDEAARSDQFAQVFIEVANQAAMDWVKAQPRVTHFVNVVDGYCTATVGLDRLADLAAHPGVIEIEKSRVGQPALNESVESMHGWDGLPPEDPRRLTQGSGVVIGIVDYGLDFTLDDFRNPGTEATRIAYLWDQQLAPQAAEKSPGKYGYGVEYSAHDIDRALAASNPFNVVRHQPTETGSDVSGHGTHVAGIAAGNGRTHDAQFRAGKFVGVAPGATLVFVHLNRAPMVAEVESVEGTLSNSVNLAHAIAYCFEKADELKMPCVINLSMGFNGGGHDGNMVMEWIIDALTRKSGRAVVVAAGNENSPDKAIYLRGSVKEGDRVELEWANGLFLPTPGAVISHGDPTPNEVEIWYPVGSSLRVRLHAPRQDQSSEWVEPASSVVFKFDGGEEAIIDSDDRTPWGGAARIYIRLSPGTRENGIRAGAWVVELEATKAGPNEPPEGVRYDAWIERTIPDQGPRHMRSRFKDFDETNAITMTTPGTARRAITVASCNSNAPVEVSEFSGRGPTRDGRNKPDVAAPGEPVASTNAGAGRGAPPAPARRQMQGTSMSAPHVAGVVARLLSRNHYLSADEIRRILVDSASHPAGPGVWDRNWGYGEVNVVKAMKLLAEKLHG
jgi:subtilisin family serine protease